MKSVMNAAPLYFGAWEVEWNLVALGPAAGCVLGPALNGLLSLCALIKG